jgi:hypothetical protein
MPRAFRRLSPRERVRRGLVVVDDQRRRADLAQINAPERPAVDLVAHLFEAVNELVRFLLGPTTTLLPEHGQWMPFGTDRQTTIFVVCRSWAAFSR